MYIPVLSLSPVQTTECYDTVYLHCTCTSITLVLYQLHHMYVCVLAQFAWDYGRAIHVWTPPAKASTGCTRRSMHVPQRHWPDRGSHRHTRVDWMRNTMSGTRAGTDLTTNTTAPTQRGNAGGRGDTKHHSSQSRGRCTPSAQTDTAAAAGTLLKHTDASNAIPAPFNARQQ